MSDNKFFEDDPFEGLDDLESEFEDFDEYESWIKENKVDQRKPAPDQGPQVLAVNRYNEVESIDLQSYTTNELYYQAEAPSSANKGALWIRTTDMLIFYYIGDENLQWVQVSNLPKNHYETIQNLIKSFISNKLDNDFAVFKDVGDILPPQPNIDENGKNIPQTVTFTRSYLEGSIRITQHITKNHSGDEILVYETKEVL